MHDDVPFFWDNWDIMHHTYETQRYDLNTAANMTEFKLEQSDLSVILRFKYKIGEKSTLT